MEACHHFSLQAMLAALSRRAWADKMYAGSRQTTCPILHGQTGDVRPPDNPPSNKIALALPGISYLLVDLPGHGATDSMA
mmetsp:Transcript_50296/g.93964  ORF Transcript_50296/g.93964 Transcript_50296/m.93964 type:complete len:80 (+) Transcript_50296:196-435(+)